MNHWTPLILHGCQTCCLTLVGYVLGFCGITLALSGRKDVPVLTVPQHSIQNLLAAFPYNGRATCGTFFAFQARTTSWNEVWYSVTWQAWAQLSAHVPCCWSSWENMHPIVLREVKITARYTQVHLCTSMHLHCLSPPSFFFFGWSGHLLGISRQLQSFWLLISTNPIIWTTQWARSIVSLEHHAVARIINPGSHFSVQVPGEKEKKGQPINYHNHVNRLGGLLHVQVSCGVGSATHGYTGWRLSTVSQIRLYVNGNGKGWFSCCFGSEVCFSGLSLEGNFVGINPVRFSVLHF